MVKIMQFSVSHKKLTLIIQSFNVKTPLAKNTTL